MIFGRNKLYSILFICCLAGYAWLFGGMKQHILQDDSTSICLMKHVTGIPCPSCGATRSVVSLTQGHFTQAMIINPIGYLIALIMLVLPVWIAYDVIRKRDSLLTFYRKAELLLKKPRFAVPLAFLVIINWIWSITKGL